MNREVIEKTAPDSEISNQVMSKSMPWYKFLLRLRLEEFLALAFFVPMVYLTAKAYLFFKAQGHIPNVFIGDVQRVFGIIVVVIVAQLIVKYKPQWKFLRDSLPFAYCLAIYTNLHDTIHFANPNDIHDYLIAIDQWMFGVQPVVWAEQFIHPLLTEIFSFCYMVFFLFAPAVAITLYVQKKYPQFRETLISVILCFYCGYFLYVVFPAAPPRIMLKEMFTLQFDGTMISDAAIKMINLLPSDSRAAFPSLHSGVTLLTLLLSFKHARKLFWIMLPFCIGLLLSTIYLRHHYVVDMIAGFILGILAFIYSPRIDKWWVSLRNKFEG